jgi:CMP-N,N'-diacetyllegionaminic acid synthase
VEVLGIIPARSGSRAIPRKNLVTLYGRPLIAYTCDAAVQSKLLTRIVASTDDNEIAAVVRVAGIEVPFLRPSELAEDSTPMLPVVQHILSQLGSYQPDVVVLLQPTSPLRRAEHVDSAIRLLMDTEADTVVTVLEVPHNFNPASVLRMSGGVLTPYQEGSPILRRQDKPRVYARNGPAVLVNRTRVIHSGRLYGDLTRGLEMNRAESIDIDSPEDLEIAEFYLKRRHEG